MRGVTDDDPYQWLEDLESEAALAWVAERNAETRAALADGAGFASLKQSLREVLDASDRIPYTVRRGAYLYNFWQDAGHVRGVWRRTTLEQYLGLPEWEVLLDVDALATSEDEKWVWAGARVRHPDHDRALVHLSRDGGDATVVREFDLAGRAFVQDGFQVEEAKTRVGWIDADTVFLGTDFGPGSMTGAGYPRTVRRWRRGTLPGEAEPVFEAETTDVSAWGAHDTTPGFERSFVGRAMDFYRDETYLLAPDGARIRIDVPDDASAYAHRRHLIVTLRSEWLGQPAGSLLAFGFDAFLAGDRTPEVLFTPDGRTALAGHSWTRHHLILETMHDVSTRIEVLTPGSDGGPGPQAARGRPGTVRRQCRGHGPGRLRRVLPERVRLPPALHPVPRAHRRRGHHGRPQAGPAPLRRRRPDGAAVLRGFPGRHPGPVLRDRPRPLPHRPGTHPAPRLRRLRGLAHPLLRRGGRPRVAGARRHPRHRQHPGRRRVRTAVAPGRAPRRTAACVRGLRGRRRRPRHTGCHHPGDAGRRGGSNGGLLMGAMLTRYPELFGAVVAHVPLLDMLRFHRLLAGASWTAEYGDPDDAADLPHLRELSPYHRLTADRVYPPVLLTTSTRDDRVHPGHARKAAARLRELGHRVLFHENTGGGHSGAGDNEQAAHNEALMYTFLWQHLSPPNP